MRLKSSDFFCNNLKISLQENVMTTNENQPISSNNQSDSKLRFIGIFIPAEIIEIKELTCTEIVLLAIINALHCKKKGGCFATNQYLAAYVRVKESSITNILTKFRRLGLIEDVNFDGRHRVIRSCIYKKSYEQQSGTYEQFGPSYEQQPEADSMYRGGTPLYKGDAPPVERGSTPSTKGIDPLSHYYIYNNIYKEKRYKYINAQTAPQLHNNHPTPQIKFSFESSQFENISQADLDAWKDLYPDLDINRQLKEMTQWILSNPSKAKHKKLWRKFIVIWLQRSYEKLTNRVAYQQTQPKTYSAVERNTFPDKDPRPYRAKKTIILEDEDLPSLSNGKTPLTPLE
jgi:hypothetical protein